MDYLQLDPPPFDTKVDTYFSKVKSLEQHN